MSVLFLNLKTFSDNGGIQKVGRVAGKAIYEYSRQHQEQLKFYSMNDAGGSATEPYLPKNIFKGFAGNKAWFVIKSIHQGLKSRVIVLSHINLLLPAYIVKLFSKNTRLILIAHGIEVWRPLSSRNKKMLNLCDIILPVSHFTKEKMKEQHSIPEERFSVLYNCLDPFLPPPLDATRRFEWRRKYGIEESAVLLMTLSRLTIHEKNKGYDKVLVAIQKLLPEFPNLKYIFLGKYDSAEKSRLDDLIDKLGIKGKVIFTGFVPDDELADHYNMCDVYIMPSEKEGFGISFIEAMYYHKPAIAGNRDGSTGALLNGRLGLLIDPRSQEEISIAIKKIITNITAFTPDRELLMQNFSYDVYRERWEEISS
ncbi:MAG: glycosyltransferase family 4 protein [Ginsengibacter sp.]